MLAADEPTTGLDGVSAERVVRALKEQAVSGNTAVVASLHQPSSKIWLKHIDAVVLLAPGGTVAYAGSTEDVPRFVKRVTGEALLPYTNPAEWLLEVVTDVKMVEKLADKRISSSSRRRMTTREPCGRLKRAPLLQRISLLFGRARRQVLRDGRVHALRCSRRRASVPY